MQILFSFVLLGVLFAKVGLAAGVLFLLILFIVIWLLDSKKRSAIANRVSEQGNALKHMVSKHSAELSARRKMLSTDGTYGRVETQRWEKEKGEFLSGVLGATREAGPLLMPAGEARSLIDRALDEMGPSAAYQGGSSPRLGAGRTQQGSGSSKAIELTTAMLANASISPTQFEHSCADVLRSAGWEANVTKASGDQGADVVATKGGRKVVVQCKLYSSPVGNYAVQEIHAAKGIYSAQHAVVVTNNAYTRSAKEAARALDVHLMHHYNLHELEFKLTGVKPQPTMKVQPAHRREADVSRDGGYAAQDAGPPSVLDGRARERSLVWSNGKWAESKLKLVDEKQSLAKLDIPALAEIPGQSASRVAETLLRHAEIRKALDARARDEKAR